MYHQLQINLCLHDTAHVKAPPSVYLLVTGVSIFRLELNCRCSKLRNRQRSRVRGSEDTRMPKTGLKADACKAGCWIQQGAPTTPQLSDYCTTSNFLHNKDSGKTGSVLHSRPPWIHFSFHADITDTQAMLSPLPCILTIALYLTQLFHLNLC